MTARPKAKAVAKPPAPPPPPTPATRRPRSPAAGPSRAAKWRANWARSGWVQTGSSWVRVASETEVQAHQELVELKTASEEARDRRLELVHGRCLFYIRLREMTGKTLDELFHWRRTLEELAQDSSEDEAWDLLKKSREAKTVAAAAAATPHRQAAGRGAAAAASAAPVQVTAEADAPQRRNRWDRLLVAARTL